MPRSPDRTRAALLSAAARLVATHGFDAATTEAISRRARVNKALISYHFGGKRGLYRAVVAVPFEELAASLEELRAPGDPAARLAGFVERFAEVAARHPVLPGSLLREPVAAGPVVGREVRAQMRRAFECLSAILADGVRAGAFRPADPLSIHVTIVGALSFYAGSGAVFERAVSEKTLTRKDVPSPRAFLAELTALVLAGLERHP